MKSISSSSHQITSDQLEKASLPFLSWCYFSADNPEKKRRWTTLLELDLQRQEGVVGNDIFREEKFEHFSERETVYEEASQLVAMAWPQYGEMASIIRPRISGTTQNDLFESASDPKTFGQILYNMKSDCPVKWAEIVVHELGHHYLNIILTTHSNQEVFDQPWDQRGHSAIRDTERPLIGIYHGAYSQACMLQLAMNILGNDNLRKYHSGANRILKSFREKFLNDYQTIRTAGVLSFDAHIRRFLEEVVSQLAGKYCEPS